jgi:hypothetical protein
MALILIKDSTRDKINLLVQKYRKANPDLKITQDWVLTQALKKFGD